MADSQSERQALEWTEEDVLEKNNLCVKITSSRIKGKKIHSYQLGRVMRDGEQKFARFFFRGIDINDMKNLLEEVRLWIQADIDEERGNNKNKRRA